MKEITVIVERGKGKRNFSCFGTEDVGDFCLAGYGSSAREAMKDVLTSVEEFKEIARENGKEFPEISIHFLFDIGAFFDYYPLDVTAVAKYIGINPSVLRQYVTAIRVPKQNQIDKIRDGINRLAKDLGSGQMISKPVLSYIE